MQDSQGGGEPDLAKGVHRHCMKNSPSLLSCIGKRTKEGCDHGSEVGTVYSDKTGEEPVPPEEAEGILQGKSSSPQRVTSVSNLCNSRSQGAGNMGNGECHSGLGKRVCPFISGKSSMTGDPLEA